jgi:nonribosomal peptide synthetase DhbF
MDERWTRKGGTVIPQERLPATRQQQQLWFLEKLAPDNLQYNLWIALRLRGELAVGALERAISEIVSRHETLRISFTEVDGVPHQVIAAPAPLTLPVDDLSETRPDGRDEAAARFANAEVGHPFGLGRGNPLFRARLARFADDDHVLVLTIHHIVWDVRSSTLLCAELSELYDAFRSGREPSLPEPAAQHSDYTRWQREQMGGPRMAEHLEYWKQELAGLPVLELPTDRPRPAVPSFRADVVGSVVEQPELGRIRDLAAARGTRLLTVLAAAYACVMARHSGQEDVVIASILDARTEPEISPAWGFITNAVVLRVDLLGNPTFAEILDRTHNVVSGAWEHRELPFETVVSAVQAGRDASRNPLWQAGIQLFDAATGASLPELTGIQAEPVPVSTGAHPVDTSIFAFEFPDRMFLTLNYATDLFDRPRMERMLGHYRQLLLAGVADPSLRLSELPLLTPAERTRVLETWQGPQRPWRREVVHQLVAEQAARTPDGVAATFKGEDLTYRELDRRAGLLARRLRDLGIGREDIVGVALDRGLDAFVALLGILKAGGAFVALDVNHPPRRLAHILGDTATKVVVTRADLAGVPEPQGWTPLYLDRDWPEIESVAQDAPLEELASPDSLAYVLYTSGSTGLPKGVQIEHWAFAHFLEWFGSHHDSRPGARMLVSVSLVLDLSVGEIFAALTRGATAVPAPQETVVDPAAYAELIRRERVTYVGAPPGMLGPTEPGPYPDLRHVLVGGEAFSGELVNRWNLPGRQFTNGYGPTEATIGCSFYVCEHKEWRTPPPIGRAMPNRRVYVVDRWGAPAPVGVPGEILTGGLGLARGYLNLPDLTAERFVEDPFQPGQRVYRTGDLAQWTEEGQIQFLGRMDTQIKLRGLRIELEEIETVVASHPEIAHAAVLLREDTPGDKRIVAYIVGRNGHAPTAADLRTHLANELPAYMLPGVVVTLDALPLAPSGKVDRNALPAPPSAEGRQAGEFVAPATPAEEVIAETYREVLGAERVSATDGFFELGGNSLMAARVVARLQERLGVAVTIRHLLTTGSVADLAAALDAGPPALPGELELLEHVEQLSDEEVARQLAGEELLRG